MFDLIAKTLLRKPAPAATAEANDNAPASLRAEVETLFRADMDRFTRIAMDRRARKTRMPVALAA